MKTRVLSATEFKAKCLALLDQVEQTGASLTITKRGRPVAEVRPVRKRKWRDLIGCMEGEGTIVGDIVDIDTAGTWNVVSDPDNQL
jgi:prevent-host-death family protein